MIFDCHTHWGIAWEEKDGLDPKNWLSYLDRHGVDKAFLMGHANLVSSELCARDNDHLSELGKKCGDRFLPLGTAWPQHGKKGVEEAARCIEKLGMKGFKFHPWLQGFSTADRWMGEIMGVAGELKAPVFIHDGTPCYSMTDQVGGLARRFPKTRFVLTHSGLLWEWRSALETLRLKNVWGTMCGPHIRALEIFADRLDPDRVLWGSDFGFGLADQIEYRYNLFLRARIPDKYKERVLSENPVRLLKFE